jgi:hypothetical protein
MGCDPSYTDCIRRQFESGSREKCILQQWVRVGNGWGLADLDRSGQATARGLYRPYKHCWALNFQETQP